MASSLRPCRCGSLSVLKRRHGQLVMVEGALITGGSTFYSTSSRFPIAFQAVFAIIVMCTVLPLPESPRWLLKKGYEEEAAFVFSSLADVPADSSVIVRQVDEVQSTLTSQSHSSFREIFTFTKEKHFHRTMLAFWNQVMQQITGANLVIYYAGSIYENSIGLSPVKAKIVTACNGTEYFLASWALLAITGTTYLADQGNSNAAVVAAVFLFVFNTFFGIGWLTNGLSTAGNWISNFLVVMITPIAFNSIGVYTYLILAAINAVMVPTVYFFYPETSGRSLEEIGEISRVATPGRRGCCWDCETNAKHHTGKSDEKPERQM
ncbi:hypothetical protein V1517DRAFT_347146 [Lipomyces orientalis]|uniref:Uncharacterized protein n=1 Tax=Lipomyces orientalis TaxID=1233043 RepID=A0ACC3TK79_9ASCO